MAPDVKKVDVAQTTAQQGQQTAKTTETAPEYPISIYGPADGLLMSGLPMPTCGGIFSMPPMLDLANVAPYPTSLYNSPDCSQLGSMWQNLFKGFLSRIQKSCPQMPGGIGTTPFGIMPGMTSPCTFGAATVGAQEKPMTDEETNAKAKELFDLYTKANEKNPNKNMNIEVITRLLKNNSLQKTKEILGLALTDEGMKKLAEDLASKDSTKTHTAADIYTMLKNGTSEADVKTALNIKEEPTKPEEKPGAQGATSPAGSDKNTQARDKKPLTEAEVNAQKEALDNLRTKFTYDQKKGYVSDYEGIIKNAENGKITIQEAQQLQQIYRNFGEKMSSYAEKRPFISIWATGDNETAIKAIKTKFYEETDKYYQLVDEKESEAAKNKLELLKKYSEYDFAKNDHICYNGRALFSAGGWDEEKNTYFYQDHKIVFPR